MSTWGRMMADQRWEEALDDLAYVWAESLDEHMDGWAVYYIAPLISAAALTVEPVIAEDKLHLAGRMLDHLDSYIDEAEWYALAMPSDDSSSLPLTLN